MLENHAIICGYGEFGKQVISNLKEYHANHVVIIDNYDFFEQAVENGENAIFGNPAQKNILEQAGIKKAKVVIIVVHDVEYISLISHAINSINKDVKVIAKVINVNVFDSSIDTKEFIDMYRYTADIIATRTFGYLYEDKLN